MNPLRHYLRRLRVALESMRTRGYSSPAAVCLHLPRVALLHVYRRLAQPVNRSGPIRMLNRRRIRRLHASCALSRAGGRFYVIVMPGTLHFLLPCLALLPATLKVLLLDNGARRWETRLIARRFPALAFCSLARLPGTSVTHGDVITLLLDSNSENFGLIDHDCYVFDRRIFESLAPGPGHCLTAVFGGVSAKSGIAYPETSFLFLNAPVLRALMNRYHVDARIYRKLPTALRDTVRGLGIDGAVFIKDYANFFDTLHLLLALAIADGHPCRFLQGFDARAIAHVGGTSWRTTQTKELINCYADWRFLDLADDEELHRRYRSRTRPFGSAADARSSIPLTPESFARLGWIDALVGRLAAVTDPRHERPSALRSSEAQAQVQSS